MKELTSGLEDKVLKGLRNKIDQANAAVSELSEKVTQKDEEIEALRKERDEINLKFVEVTTELGNKAKEVVELKNSISSKDEEIKTLNFVVDEVNSRIELSNKSLDQNVELIDNLKNKLEKAEAELKELKPPEPGEFVSEDRLICPKCGAVGKDIGQQEDKSRVLGYVGHLPMYTKVNVCKKCGNKFD